MVVQSLLLIGCHCVLVGGHASGARLHAGSWGRDIGVCVLGRLDSRFTVDTVRVGRFGCVETCLVEALARTWTDRLMSVITYLDQVFALGLGDQRLELGGGESVDETSLGDNKQKDLSAGKDRQFVGLIWSLSVKTLGLQGATRRVACEKWATTNLLHDTSLSFGESDVTTRLVLDELDFDLSPLAARLVVVVVIVVGGCGIGGALSLDASLFGRNAVVVGGRGISLILRIGDLICHFVVFGDSRDLSLVAGRLTCDERSLVVAGRKEPWKWESAGKRNYHTE